MTDDKFDREMAENRKAYEALREEIRTHKGKYVAMAFGRIVCVSADFDEAVKAIDSLQPEPLSAVVFPADEEPGFEPIEDFHRNTCNASSLLAGPGRSVLARHGDRQPASSHND